MNEITFLVEEAPEGGYTARALEFLIFTEADTWDDLRAAILDAVSCHFDESDSSRPKMIRLHFSRQEVLVA